MAEDDQGDPKIKVDIPDVGPLDAMSRSDLDADNFVFA